MYYGCILLASLIPTAHAIMVQMADGSFVPWSLERRASGGLPLRLTNHNDSSYLVSWLLPLSYTCWTRWSDYRRPFSWVSYDFSTYRPLRYNHLVPYDRNSLSKYRYGSFLVAKFCRSSISSVRAQWQRIVRDFLNLASVKYDCGIAIIRHRQVPICRRMGLQPCKVFLVTPSQEVLRVRLACWMPRICKLGDIMPRVRFLFFLIPTAKCNSLLVVLTNGSVSDDLYPVGARGVLGYGLNAPATPANDSLIPTFLPCVNSDSSKLWYWH